jgi:CelD/BcsL family acetyltransferase involved in cellulose biosynthesis
VTSGGPEPWAALPPAGDHSQGQGRVPMLWSKGTTLSQDLEDRRIGPLRTLDSRNKSVGGYVSESRVAGGS